MSRFLFFFIGGALLVWGGIAVSSEALDNAEVNAAYDMLRHVIYSVAMVFAGAGSIVYAVVGRR